MSLEACGDAVGLMGDTILYLCSTTNSPDEIMPLVLLVHLGIQLMVQPDLEDMYINKVQEVNLNTHQHTMYPRHRV